MMSEMWPFMGSGLGMVFMVAFWFLAIVGFITVLRGLTSSVNKNQCGCLRSAADQRSENRY